MRRMPHSANVGCHAARRGLAVLSLLALGCGFPGKPDAADMPVRPDQITDFAVLYRQNCSGCHGADGAFGPAPPLADPLFVHLIDESELVNVITHGRPGALMPPMARSHGGGLTAEQVKILARGIKTHWAAKQQYPGAPPYLAAARKIKEPAAAQIERGTKVFARACASCHGATGHGEAEGGDAGAINDANFLSLVSDQVLRRTIITGRADLGMPDYASSDDRPDDFRPLSPQDVEDLVALLVSWRADGEKP